MCKVGYKTIYDYELSRSKGVEKSVLSDDGTSERADGSPMVTGPIGGSSDISDGSAGHARERRDRFFGVRGRLPSDPSEA